MNNLALLRDLFGNSEYTKLMICTVIFCLVFTAPAKRSVQLRAKISQYRNRCLHDSIQHLCPHASRWCSGMTLAWHGEGPGFETQTILCSISYFLLLLLQHHCFVLFALFFTQWLIYPFSFHIDILI